MKTIPTQIDNVILHPVTTQIISLTAFKHYEIRLEEKGLMNIECMGTRTTDFNQHNISKMGISFISNVIEHDIL